jgi:cation-transporting P-type ATPase 13A2
VYPHSKEIQFNADLAYRFIPPHLDREKSNIENSENTTLFLVSCYEYILSGIVLSVGPPFRQSMAHNCTFLNSSSFQLGLANQGAVPFVVTIVVALLFSSYMLFDPSESVAKFMQLTKMSWDFKSFILILGIGYIASAWASENYLLPRLAKYLGSLKTAIMRKPKQRKAYKIVLEKMRTLQ